MTVAELCEYLASQYDPEAPVQCVLVQTDWEFNGEESIPVDRAYYDSLTAGQIDQLQDGTIRIGEKPND